LYARGRRSCKVGHEIWSDKVKSSSKIKPRLRAECVLLSEELPIMAVAFKAK